MKTLPLHCFLVVLLSSSAVQAAVITQWNFDSSNTTPSTGSGTTALVGSATATFAAGNGGGQGWNTTTYAAQSVGSGTVGTSFFLSTAGYEDITVSFDLRASGTASRWVQYEYTVNGGTSWATAGNNNGNLSPHDTFYALTFDLSAIAAVDGAAGFGIRMVSIFSPVAFDQNATLGDFAANTAYQRANAQSGFAPGSGVGTGDYGAGGTWRFDNVTVSGTAVPEPASILLGTFGLLGLLRRRR